MILFADNTRGLQPLDYLVVAVYMAAVLGVGLYFSRGQREGEDYFVAGRRMPWMAVGLSVVATLMSTLTYLALPGELIQHGIAMSIGWTVMPLAFLVISFLWLPFFMRLRLTSVYEYLEMRFGLVARWVGVAMFVFILRLFWMGLIVLTAAKAVAQITYDSATEALHLDISGEGWELAVLLAVGVLATAYTVLGGIKAVIWTDVAQFVVLAVGAVLTLIVIAVDTQTGPVQWWQTITAGGQQGHEMPPFISWDLTQRETILFPCLHSFFWYTCTYVADQVAMQRYFTTPSVRAAVLGNIVNFVADLALMVLLALCGMALLSYYLAIPAEILPGVTDPRDPAVADKIFPHFIANGLPVGIAGLVVAALFAVAMSSLDSGVNSVSAVLTVDVFGRLLRNFSKQRELLWARGLSVIIGLGCTGLAWCLMRLPKEYNIIDVTAKTFNCALGPLAAMFVAGMFLPHVGQTAVVVAAACGLVVAFALAWWPVVVWMLGLTDAATVSAAIETVPQPNIFLITPAAATTAILVAAVLGALLPSPDPQKVRRLTWRAVVREHTMDRPDADSAGS